MPRRRDGERGVALIMVLLTVTLLTILVIEFTYTIQVESHISRNSVNALQATYLARSGINILAGALRQDEDRQVDPGEEDPWRYFALGPCQNILENETWVPPNWKLCGRIVDESGKLNVNFTSPPPQQNPGAAAQNPDTECKPANSATVRYCWRDAIAQLASSSGVDPQAVKQALDDYWITAVPPPKIGQRAKLVADEFASLEDVASAFPLLQNRTVFESMRKYVTALPTGGKPQTGKLNCNTVSPTVLRAILSVTNNDEAVADEVVSKRLEAPFKNCSEAFGQVDPGLLRMFGTTSNVFRLETSAVVNGVAKTVRTLVLREPGPPRRNGPPGATSWRLTYLDWQKESGAGAARDARADAAAGPEGLEADDNSANTER